MAATLSCHYCPSLSPSSKLINLYNIPRLCPLLKFSENPLFSPTQTLLFFPNSPSISNPDQEDRVFPFKECAISIALAIGLITGVPALDWCNYANAATPAVLPELSGLISGPPIQDPRALLRHALPIDNKAREVQKPLEDITDSLKIAGLKALDSVERNVRQASRALKQGKSLLVSGLAESKKDHGIELLGNLEDGMDLPGALGFCSVEEDMVDGFPYKVPEEYQNMPLLKGRATVNMKVKDLVERHFYDGMEIQRADGFVVQTGDPEGPAEDFIDPSTGKTCTIPSETMVNGEKVPFYRQTLEVRCLEFYDIFFVEVLIGNTINFVLDQPLDLYKAQTRLPFNVFGTMAMARDFENNFASSQVFWLLKESELTPSNANLLDGREAVFGYVTDNEDFLADVNVVDVIFK
ncbi:unnamed protein product [Camellia sinensis]